MENTLVSEIARAAAMQEDQIQTSRRIGGGLTLTGLRTIQASVLLQICHREGYKFSIPISKDNKCLTINLQSIDDITSAKRDSIVLHHQDNEEDRIVFVSNAELVSKTRSGNTTLLKFTCDELNSDTLLDINTIETVITTNVYGTGFSVIVAKPSDSRTSLFFLKRHSKVSQNNRPSRASKIARKRPSQKSKWTFPWK